MKKKFIFLAIISAFLFMETANAHITSSTRSASFTENERALSDQRKNDPVDPRVIEGSGARPNDPIFDLVPDGVHPRLLLREEDLPALRKKITHPGAVTFYNRVVSLANASATFDLGPPSGPNNRISNAKDSILRRIEAKALMYILDRTANHQRGLEAVAMARQYMNTLQVPAADRYWGGIDIGNAMYSCALAYDWCYDLISKEDKEWFVSQFFKLADQHEGGYPRYNQGVVTGHAAEQGRQREMVATGIALADENWLFYYDCARLWVNRFAPSINLFHALGAHHQGTDYGSGRFRWSAIGNLIFYRMLPLAERDVSKSRLDDSLVETYKWFIYLRRPDGQSMRFGDIFNSWIFGHWDGALYVNAIYRDPYLQGYMSTLGTSTVNAVEAFIFYDVNIVPESISAMPLSRYWNTGELIARTGWTMGDANNNNSMIVTMRIKELHLNNHDHLDAGSFMIYYKGCLAVDNGHYDSYFSSHDSNWDKKTISHNSLLIRDPNVPAGHYGVNDVANDGGQIWPGSRNEPNSLGVDPVTGKTIVTDANSNPHNNWPPSGETLAHQFGPDPMKPDFSYLKGDINSLYGYRADRVNRSMVTLNFFNDAYPGALVVFDNITATSANFDKYYLLQSTSKPVVNGRNTIITRLTSGNNPQTVSQLINTTLLDNMNIEIVEPFDIFGTKYEPRRVVDSEAGGWRIQVSPQKGKLTDLMLNVLQVSDAGADPLTVTQIGSATDNIVGARIFDRVVMFSTSDKLLTSAFTIPAAGNGERVKYLITDMAEGRWAVRNASGNLIDVIDVTTEGRCGYFSAASNEVLTLSLR